jgi:hypothetical protein
MTADLIDRGADAKPDAGRTAASEDVMGQDFLSRRAAGEKDETRGVILDEFCALFDQFAAALEAERWAVMSHTRKAVARA